MRCIGLDVHHKYVHVTELTEDGLVSHARLPLTEEGLESLKERLGQDANVVLEASTSSATLYDALRPHAQSVVVAHATQTRGASSLHVKTDQRDAEILARLLAAGFVRPVWVPPPDCRALRTLMEFRSSLTRARVICMNQIYACFRGRLLEYPPELCRRNMEVARTVEWSEPHQDLMVRCILALKRCLEEQLGMIDKALEAWCTETPMAQLLRTIPGFGPVLTAAVLCEIGDIQRFPSTQKLCAYAGLVPKVHASGKTLSIGRLAKGGRHQLRWAVYMATLHLVRKDERFKEIYSRLCERRPKRVALIACARKLLVVVWHMLRRQQPFRRQLKT